MLMPEATSNFNCFLASAKNQIWFPGKVLRMKAVAIAHPVDHSPHDKFGLHPLAFYSAHVFAAPCR